QPQGPVSGRRGCRLCRRHPLGRRGRHQGRRGGGQVDVVRAEPLSMKLDDIKKLQQKKYRAEFGHFLVEGEHLLLELQKAAEHDPRLQRSQLYVTAAYEHWQSPFRTQVISERQMAQIADTRTPQGILAVVP